MPVYREPLSRKLWRARRKLQVWRHNPFTRLRLRALQGGGRTLSDLFPYERRVYSQHGEDGVLEAIFAVAGATNKYFVEFGVGDGMECNTSFLAREQGWTGLLMDGRGPSEHSAVPIRREFIDAENINSLFEKYGVPPAFDLLSIDLDGNDYWIWKALDGRWRPRVVAVEYNSSLDPTDATTIAYDPAFRWDGSAYYGASLGALDKLARQKGYRLVGCESSGTNAFFVQEALAAAHFAPRDLVELYRPPIYGKNRNGYAPPPREARFVSV